MQRSITVTFASDSRHKVILIDKFASLRPNESIVDLPGAKSQSANTFIVCYKPRFFVPSLFQFYNLDPSGGRTPFNESSLENSL